MKQPDDKRRRQSAYLDALGALSSAEVILGKFYRNVIKCRKCKEEWFDYEEKMTDSAIAANLVADAFLDDFDMALLIGGDTDIVPAVRMVRRHFPRKRLEAWFPPNRKNQAVADECDDEGQITGAHLERAIMPDRVEVANGVYVERPAQWVQGHPRYQGRRQTPDR